MKPRAGGLRALDLFCGAGGASRGLADAGFKVVGVDIAPQPEYPFLFVQADALEYPLGGVDFIWASPPCQAHTTLRGLGKANAADLDLIPAVRERLVQSGIPYVIENVVGAPLYSPLMLCGSMFGLAVRRHRLFEASFPAGLLASSLACSCRSRKNIAVYGKAPGHRLPDGVQRARSVEHGREAMGIDWMSWRPLTQAIPPAYSRFLAQMWLVQQPRQAVNQ